MAKKVGKRQNKTFVCSKCGSENSRESKNVQNTPERMTKSRYCPKCRMHTEHKEKK